MKDTRKLFSSINKDYTPDVMWFTGGNISKKEMTYQMEGFSKQGINDFFIHPANGTEGDYLGDHFFDMIKHATTEAERIGMNFWIYDEYNWPSGIAAGQVFAEAPWARSSRLFRVTKTVAPHETLKYILPSKARYNTQVQHISVDGCTADAVCDGETVWWTNDSDAEKTIEIYMSKWMMGITPAAAGSNVVADTKEGALDTLDVDAVRVFIDKTHEAYKRHIGEHFGYYVKGIFSDEVTIYYELRDNDEIGLPTLPWTRLFPEKFIERNGYDIRPKLKELMDKTDIKLSIDYWDTVCELFTNGFAKTIGDWCRENNLIFTGHIDAEESLNYAVYGSGDPYEYYKHFDRPGIDTIFSYYRINDYSYNVAPKLAASAAHFHGKDRVLSETYTVSGWDIRLSDMKRIFNRLALHGINFIQFMGARYSFMPGSDSSAMTNNWQNPLFKHYRELSKYISGIQALVSQTVYDCGTLVFYPLTTVKATLGPLPVNIFNTEMNFTFNGAVNSLLNLNIPFEVGFEQVINSGVVDRGVIKFNESEYHTVIMPCTSYLRETTYFKLREFARGGGRIVLLNCEPIKVIGDTVYDAEPFDGCRAYDCRNYEMCGEHATNFDSYQCSPMGEFTEKLQAAILDMPSPIVRVECRDGIMSAMRRDNDSNYAIIINDNPVATEVNAEVLSDKPFCVINTETGELRQAEILGKRINMILSPFECVVIEISDGLEDIKSSSAELYSTEVELRDIKFRPADKNIGLPDVYHVRGEAAEKILKARRLYNPKQICDIANELLDSDTVVCRGFAIGDLPVKAKHDWFGWFPIDKKPITSGDDVVCVYDFNLDTVPEDLEMIADPAFNTVWYLNGEQLYPGSTRRVWHYANQVYDLSAVAKPGRNRMVSICTVPMCDRTYPVPCAILKGDFRVYSDFVLTHKAGRNGIGVWNDKGYACYSGDGIYTASFTAKSGGRMRVAIDTKDTVEVIVNGKSVCKRLWAPYDADISDYICSGENTLELRVSSTYSNTIYNSNPSGISDIKIFAK